jgi:hypothetical protein
MKIPYSRKSEILVRGLFRFTAPWLFGKFSLEGDRIILKYFFKTKEIPFTEIKKAKVFDNVLEIILEKESFQIRNSKAAEMKGYIEKRL